MTPFDGERTEEDASSEQPPDFARLYCWRCGLAGVPVRGLCPHCRARLIDEPGVRSQPSESMPPLLKVMIGFSLLLGISLIWGWILHFSNADRAGLVVGTIALEIVDTVLTLVLWVWIGWVTVPRPAWGPRSLFWLAGWPALAGVLAFNLSYHQALEQFLHPPEWLKVEPLLQGLTPMNILLISIQPAIVEELFFRHLTLGSLRQVSGVHAAVWVSALMFALAHIYEPLGLPWLLVAGVVFGYARVGGSLLLPMLLHGCHNFGVLWIAGGV